MRSELLRLYSEIRTMIERVHDSAAAIESELFRIQIYGEPEAIPRALNKVSDRVQAVVAYVAPTDLTIMVKDYKDRLPAYANFPALNLDMEGAKTYSPLLHVSEDDAPTLLLAGAKDDLVPISHSRNIEKALGEKKIDVKIVEYPEAGHGFGGEDLKASVEQMVAWFDKHLGKK